MQILILIFTALAAVLAGAALILVVEERHHRREFVVAVDQRFKGMAKANKESKTALIQYVDQGDKKCTASVEQLRKDTDERFEKYRSVLLKMLKMEKERSDKSEEIEKRVEDLEHGVVPDYETARKAADEFNKFNEGIAGILGYDPLKAMKKSRQEDN